MVAALRHKAAVGSMPERLYMKPSHFGRWGQYFAVVKQD